MSTPNSPGAAARFGSTAALTMTLVAAAHAGKRRDIVELEPRPVKPPAADVAPSEPAAPPPPDSPADGAPSDAAAAELASAAAPAQASPWTVWVGSSTAFQTLQGADGAANDYVQGYLDIVLDGRLWEGAAAQVEFEGSGGNGPDSQVGGFAGLWNAWNANSGTYQSPDGFDRLLLAEAYVSLETVAEGWILDVGKIACTNYLDSVRVANSSVANFLAGSFTNSLAFGAPFRGAGAAVTYVGDGDFDFRAVVLRPNNSGTNASSHVFGGAQVSLYWSQDTRPGAAYLYAWTNGGDNDRTGAGLNLDQDLGGHTTAFARLGWADEVHLGGAVDTAIESSWVAGLECRGSLWSRDSDSFALAVGSACSHDDSLDNEFVFEGYFKRVVNDHCELSLHVQGIDQLAGDATADLITAIALRMNIWL